MLEARVAKYLVDEIQEVYRLRVCGNDKHIEAIVRQMLRRVSVSDPGDTNFRSTSRSSFTSSRREERARDRGRRQPAKGDALLLGTEGVAVDRVVHLGVVVQETTKVLTEASTLRRLPPRLKERHHGALDPGRHRPGAYKRLTVDVRPRTRGWARSRRGRTLTPPTLPSSSRRRSP